MRVDGININAVNKAGRTPLDSALNNETKTLLIGTALLKAAENGDLEIVKALIEKGADVTIKNKDKKTPFDLTTSEEIKALLQNAEKEKQEGDVQPGSEVIKKENSEEGSDRSQREQGISAEEGNDLKTEGVGSGASAESAQTEEQPSSFFGSLFSILILILIVVQSNRKQSRVV